MARVTLDFLDLDDGPLPDVCIACGAPATATKSKLYSWHHPALYLAALGGVPGLLVLVVLSNVLAKRRRVDRPFCEEHLKQWPWRSLTAVGGLLLIVLIVVAGLAAFYYLTPQSNTGPNALPGLLCLGIPVLLVIWLIVVAVIYSTSIRPAEITDRFITLQNVAPAFADACESELGHNRRVRIDDIVRDRWRGPERRPSRDDDADDRRPNRPRPPSDAYEPE